MPVSYRIDVANGIVYSEARGRVTDDEMIDHQNRLRDDPAFRSDFRQLYDFRGVEAVAVTTSGVRRLAEGNVFGAGSRRAIVTAQEAVYGLVRMYQTLKDQSPDVLRIFRDDIEEARTWLGCPPAPDPPK